MRSRAALLAMATAVTLLGAACSDTGSAASGSDGGAIRGSVPAPEFPSGLDWYNTGGRSLAMSELQGKVVAVHFWSGSCVTCVQAQPDLERLADEFGGSVIVVGVHAPRFTGEATPAAALAAIVRNDVVYPVVADHSLAIARGWGVEAQPTTVIVDPAGQIVGVHAGDAPYGELQPVVASLVEGFSGHVDAVARDFPLEIDVLPQTVLAAPAGVAVASQHDRIYIADTANHRIVVALPEGDVLAVYGSGESGLIDAAGTEAAFHEPHGLALSADEATLYVADTGNHAVRAVDLTTGAVATVAGTGSLGPLPPVDGRASEAVLRSPWDVAVVGTLLYVTMAGSNQLWSIDLNADRADVVAGSGEAGIRDGAADEALLSRPSGVTAGGDGTVYFTDPEAGAIRALDREGEAIATVAGPANLLFAFGDVDGRGRDARFQLPLGIALDGDSLLVADTLNHALRSVSLGSAEVTTRLGGERGWRDGDTPLFFEPAAVDVVAGTAYVADRGNNVVRIVDLAAGMTRTLVLRGIEAFAPTPDEADYRGTVIELPVTEVAAGEGAVVLDIQLPAGHKVNDEAPSSITWSAEGDVVAVVGDSPASLTGTDLPVVFSANFREGDGSLTADLNLFWCAEGAESLCFIEQVRFIAPLSVGGSGANEVVMPYVIELPEIPG